MCVQRECGILFSMKPVVFFSFSFPFLITTFSHSARGRIFENKAGDTLLFLCSFSFLLFVVFDSRALFSLWGLFRYF